MTPFNKHSVRILLLLQGFLFAINSNAQFLDYLKGGANDGVSSARNGTCVVPINVVIGGGFDGAGSVVSSNCPAPVNVVTGGAYDGSSAVVGGGCASPSNVVAGGSYDGTSSVISSNCAAPTNVFTGGSFDGVSAFVGGGCAAPSNVVAGGSFDGVSSVISSNCAAPINVVSGGAFDGTSAVVGGGCAAPSNVVAGGSFDGVSSVISSNCAAPVNVVSGGAFDGASAVVGGGCAAPSNVVAGGSFDGVSSVMISNCAALVNVVTGGSFDGVSSIRIGNCAGLANVVAGGSFDGAAYRLLACGAINIAQLNTINATCGICDGTATAYVIGGFTPYNYIWSSGATSSSLTGLCAGSYDLTVSDAASSSSSRTVIISSTGTAPTLNFLSATNVSCNGGNNGSLTVSASGGTLPYTFSWSNGASASSISSLPAGSYSITVTEANGCSSSTSATITQPAAYIASCGGTNVTCNGSGNGSASVTASGGTPSYTYLWSNGSTKFQITNLQPQTYSITITDSRGCVTSCSYNVTGPSTLVASSSSTGILCKGQTATINVSASGGTSPYSGTGNFIRNAGIYTFTVSDNNGCTASSTYNLTEPTALSAYASAAPILCNGHATTVTVSASGGSPSYAGTGSFSRTAGNYTFIVTDSKGCTASSFVNLTEPSVLSASSSATAILCNGRAATVTVTASGGTPSYFGTGIFQKNAGFYTFIVTDNNSCTVSTSITISEPSALSISLTNNTPICSNNNVNINSSVSGGMAGYRYSWTGPSNFSSTVANPVITSAVSTQTGTYSLIVTDANNCTSVATTYVEVDNCFTTLALNLYIQGYYQGSGFMRPVMFSENVIGSTVSQTDTITVVLRNAVVPTTTIDSAVTILMRNGTAVVTFSPSIAGHSYYIVVKHRNSVQTWSKTPVLFSPNTSYSFTTANSTAYGDNLVQVDFGPVRWAIYTGDINQDENIDLIDFPALDIGIINGLTGYYKSDLNGDGNVDLIDFPVLDANINMGIFSRHP